MSTVIRTYNGQMFYPGRAPANPDDGVPQREAKCGAAASEFHPGGCALVAGHDGRGLVLDSDAPSDPEENGWQSRYEDEQRRLDAWRRSPEYDPRRDPGTPQETFGID